MKEGIEEEEEEEVVVWAWVGKVKPGRDQIQGCYIQNRLMEIGPGKLLLVGVRDFADLRPKIRQTLAPFFVDLRA